eukprot:jgi/Hompol1/1909/HPOL_000224-RA
MSAERKTSRGRIGPNATGATGTSGTAGTGTGTAARRSFSGSFSGSAGSAGSKPADRSRSATGPHGPAAHAAWKPSPEAAKLWRQLNQPAPDDELSIQHSFVNHVSKTLARSAFNMDDFAAYQAVAFTVRDRLLDRWNATQQYHSAKDPKRVYYLSLEFLIGRTLDNAILNLGLKDRYKSAIGQIGFNLEDLISEESDAALGNGGLGYGIRYTYGIFQQRIVDGYQTEYPDYWLTFGNPWEIQRLDVAYEVRFRGYVNKYSDAQGNARFSWEGGEKVLAVAYDYPIPGFGTKNTINIRLWSSKPTNEFDFASFNEGNYDKSVEQQKAAENITSVLYPNDNHMVGKILRHYPSFQKVVASLVRVP